VPSRLSRLGLWFRVLVTAAGLALVLRTLEWTALAELPGRLSLPLLLLAACCMGLAYPLHAVRLGILLRQQGIALPFRELHRITWISVFFGSFTPGGVGGDVSRLLHVHGRVPLNKTGGAVAVVADRVVGLATLLFLAAAAANLHVRSAADSAPELVALAPLFAFSFVALGLGWTILARRRFSGRFAALSAAARLTLRPVAPLLAALGVSLAIWTADFVAGWLLARALGWPVGLVEISVALAVAYTIASLPLSIGGHGVREGALVVVLGWFGLSAGAPQLAVAFLALMLLLSLAGGGVYLLGADGGASSTARKSTP
jgi:glycosyltransferase 2 family protein